MWATIRGNTESVKKLFDLKIDPYLRDPLNLQSVDYAILYGRY